MNKKDQHYAVTEIHCPLQITGDNESTVYTLSFPGVSIESKPLLRGEGAHCALSLFAGDCIYEAEFNRLALLTGWEMEIGRDCTASITIEGIRYPLCLEEIAVTILMDNARREADYIIGYDVDDGVDIALHHNNALSRMTVHQELEDLRDVLREEEWGGFVCRLLEADVVWEDLGEEESGYLLYYVDRGTLYWFNHDVIARFREGLEEMISTMSI